MKPTNYMKPSKFVYLLSLIFTGTAVFAQDQAATATAAAPSSSSSGNLLMDIVMVVFIITALVLLGVSLVLLHTFKVLSKELLNPTKLPVAEPQKFLEYEEWATAKKAKPGIVSRVLGLRPISEEKDIMLEHQFDGIAELDNPTPGWFMWLFYGTIAFAIGYLLNYHVFNWGKLQDEEYTVEMREAKAAKDAYLAKSANLIDENTVKESHDGAVISAGQAVFTTNCIACHGDKAQGIVGPNLTDEYWLHGGKINNIFKTIKYGVPEKGMISWEKTLTPKQISEVANFILSLKGSNPPGAKAPQGEKEG